MEHIAFKAHKTRGPEIIKILESLGGVNIKQLDATGETRESVKIVYYVTHYGTIGYNPLDMVKSWGYKIYTIEEYEAMNKEKEKQELLLGLVSVANKGQELIPHKDYEIKQDGDRFYLVKKKKEYPKTFEECCKILGLLNVDLCFNADYRSFDASKEQWKRLDLMNQFYQLLICRDAYWKLYGEEMGLGKPWKPDWNNISDKYCIYFVSGDAWSKECQTRQCPFAFPTAEMRDAFKENFDPDLDKCKELI